MSRQYEDMSLDEALAIITEEVSFSGDSFGWSGIAPTPLVNELAKRGIIYIEGLIGA